MGDYVLIRFFVQAFYLGLALKDLQPDCYSAQVANWVLALCGELIFFRVSAILQLDLQGGFYGRFDAYCGAHAGPV